LLADSKTAQREMRLYSIEGNTQKLDGGAMLFGTSMCLTLRCAQGRLRRPDSLPANLVGNAHEVGP
jgi:hypothetical protein